MAVIVVPTIANCLVLAPVCDVFPCRLATEIVRAFCRYFYLVSKT